VSQVFPRWMNSFPAMSVMGVGGGAVFAIVCITYFFTPKFWEVGYEPVQPVNYNHQLHAGTLGIDCRYCHSRVEESPIANVPDTATCMNCHTGEGEVAYLNANLWSSHKDNPNLQMVRASYESGEPIQWRRVHKLPDYVQFNHATHIKSGVSCYSCHGRIDQQQVVRQSKNLSMGWCLECHRAPEHNLIDTDVMAVTDLMSVERQIMSDGQLESGLRLAESQRLQPPQSCGACHY